MEYSIDAIAHMFFRLSPFILVCFFSLYSIFNKNVKGIIYLAGLLLACFITILLGNFPDIQVIDTKTGFPMTALNKECRMIETTESGPISFLPLSQTVLAYTLFFVGYPIIMNDFTQGIFNSRNLTIFVFFVLLIVADYWWNFSKNCFGFFALLISLIIGGGTGILWGYIIQKSGDNLQLFRSTSTSKSCNNKDKQVHRCRPKVDTYAYKVNADLCSSQVNSQKINMCCMCTDFEGNIYITDTDPNNVIRKITYKKTKDKTYNIYANTIIAGSFESSTLKTPQGICTDNNGNVYFAESDNHCIRKIDKNGNITVVAGTPNNAGSSGDNGLATKATLNTPVGICIDKSGNIYFTDTGNNVVRMVNTSGVISLIAGNYTVETNKRGKDDVKATSEKVFFNTPTGICIDVNNNIYVSDTMNDRIRKIKYVDQIITTILTGTITNVSITKPTSIFVDVNGNIVFNNNYNKDVCMADKTFTICTKILDGTTFSQICLNNDSSMYILTYDGSMYSITNYSYGSTSTYKKSDNIYDNLHMFNSPLGITYDNKTQNMYMADSNNHVIRKVDPKLNISVYAGVVGQSTPFDTTSTSTSNNCANKGTGSTCQSITNYATKVQENGNVLQTTFNNPTDVCVDKAGNVYVADCSNNVIRKITANGNITTYGGNGNNRIDSLIKPTPADYINIVSNELSYPSRIAADSTGNIYVIEASYPEDKIYGNNTVRMIKPNGTITVFAGSEDNTTNAAAATATVAGKTNPGNDNGILLSAKFTNPSGIFIDTRDNIYIIDNDGINIRKISDNKVSTIIDENNNTKKEKFNYIMVDKNQHIYATTKSNTVILIKAKHTLDKSNNDTINYTNNGILNYTQIAGGTTDVGTNTIALNAKISNPMGLCQDVNKNLFFVEGNSLRKMYQSGNLK